MDVLENVNYCLSCRHKPCRQACPLNNDITEAIALFKKGLEKEAYDKFMETTVLPSICGRICPHENQCQGSCVRGIRGNPVQIGNIEYYLGDKFIDVPLTKDDKYSGYHVAVIGGGPAGLTCAAFLARNGVHVTLYEKHHYLGGILMHGIPEFRLPKVIVKKTIDKILALGIEVRFNQELGKDISLSDLIEQYDAIYLAIGANKSKKMRIPGEELDGVYGGNEVLENNAWPELKDKKVVVSGGGNTAMDVARSAKRLGADVTIIYRRSEKEMPATKVEIAEAKNEKIHFMFTTNILEVLGDNKVKQLHCIKTELVAKEGETRLSPVNIPGSDFMVDCDYIFMAVGSNPDQNVTTTLNLELTKWNSIVHNQLQQTSIPNVFVGGDIGDNKATVAFASRSGRDGANFIINYLNHK